jgi:hypothetical protein
MKYVSPNQQPREFHVSPGEYEVRVIDAIETISKGSGQEMIKLMLEVEGRGVRLYDYLIASASAAWKIDAFRRATGEDVSEGEEVHLTAQDLIGRQGRARLKVEEFQGRLSNKVDAWLAPAKRPEKPAEPDGEDDDNVPF